MTDDDGFPDSYPPPDPRDVRALVDFVVRLDAIVAEAKRLYIESAPVDGRILYALHDAISAAEERGVNSHDDPESNTARDHHSRWNAVRSQLQWLPWHVDDLYRAIAGTPRVPAWKYPCPRCNAPAGEPCRYTAGPAFGESRPAYEDYAHKARRALVGPNDEPAPANWNAEATRPRR
jgi:hypothetical protein